MAYCVFVYVSYHCRLPCLYPPLVDAGRVVHGLHAAAGYGLDVDLLLARGQRGEAAGGEGQVCHLIIAGISAEGLKTETGNYFMQIRIQARHF